MKIKADLHTHFSTFENIGKIFNKAIDVAQQRLGISGVFAAVNGQEKGIGRYETLLGQKGYERQDLGNAFYVPGKGIYVVKGQEVFTEGGHILVLGLPRGIKLRDYRSLEDSLKEAKDNNGIIIADHPFFLDGIFTKNKPSDYIHHLDGIEVHNGEAWIPIPNFKHANEKAQELYNNVKHFYSIGALSVSDGHSVQELGLSYSLLEPLDFSSPEKLVSSLRRAIRMHKDFSQDKQKNSYTRALDHATKIAIARFASKLGLIGRIN